MLLLFDLIYSAKKAKFCKLLEILKYCLKYYSKIIYIKICIYIYIFFLSYMNFTRTKYIFHQNIEI